MYDACVGRRGSRGQSRQRLSIVAPGSAMPFRSRPSHEQGGHRLVTHRAPSMGAVWHSSHAIGQRIPMRALLSVGRVTRESVHAALSDGRTGEWKNAESGDVSAFDCCDWRPVKAHDGRCNHLANGGISMNCDMSDEQWRGRGGHPAQNAKDVRSAINAAHGRFSKPLLSHGCRRCG